MSSAASRAASPTTVERAISARVAFASTSAGVSGIDLTLLPDELFVEENINPNGLEIKEETRPTDYYAANHDVGAAYVMADPTIGKWRVHGGLRYEDSDIKVTTLDPFNLDAVPIESQVDDREVMPALAASTV